MSDNITVVLLAGALIILMQGGFALVTTGLCRAKNGGQIVAMNFLILPLTVLSFWVCGFAFFTGGQHGYFLSSVGEDPMLIYRVFFLAVAYAAVAAAIPAGAMAERWKFKNFSLYGLWAAALPIPIFAHWVWNDGWLAGLGQSCKLGHGFVDFAGSAGVHMAGGVMGLVGATMLGPRVGKYSRDGRPRPMPGHNLIYVALGTLVLAFGWFGFTLGPAIFGAHERVPLIVLNTLLALATGTLGAYAIVIMKFGKPDPSMLCNGMLAGLVAISGPCAFVNPTGAAIIGAVAGVLVVYSVLFFEGTVKIDDPVGAISVHGVCGAWGILSIGLLANGSGGAGLNGIHSMAKDGTEFGVAGAFGTIFGSPANDWSQLGAQAVGAVVCLLFFAVFAFVWFKISGFIVPMRPRREEEIAGLDLPEMGAECYPDFHLTDKGSSHNE